MVFVAPLCGQKLVSYWILSDAAVKDNVDEPLDVLQRVSCCPRNQRIEPQFRENSVPTKSLIFHPRT